MFRNEILRKNGTSIIGSRPIWDVGIMNSTETAQLSQMTLVKLKTQPNVPHHIFVKGMIIITFISFCSDHWRWLCCFIADVDVSSSSLPARQALVRGRKSLQLLLINFRV
jgi:hypothetical protein